MATNYIDTYDREKELSLMDKLAEHQVLITKRRRAMAAARALLAKAKRDERAIKSEIFINRMGQAEYQRRQNGAKKAGLAHTAAAARRKAALAFALSPPAPLIVANPDFESASQHLLAAITREPLPVIAVTPEQIASTHAAAAHADGDVRRCRNCAQAITRRGLCGCAGVRHREFRTIAKGPVLNIKHAPVPAYQMEGNKE